MIIYDNVAWLMKKRWKFLSDNKTEADILAKQLNISSILAQLLVHRGIASAECGRHFLYDTLAQSYDPFIMKDMEKSAARICWAIDNDEKIVIYGDYDVDGITSTALLYTVLSDLGAAPSFYIPERQREGYGLNREALRRLADESTDLLITVDCGISSSDLVAEFSGVMDIIITDHHEPPEKIPQAYAVLNPKQVGCKYPFKELAGVGVVYKLCQALWLRRRKSALLQYSEIAALGTIADMVPLTGENRLFVRDGLKRMKEGHNIGIQALLTVSSLTANSLTAGRIAFTAAPRLNAAGRISYAVKGVQLLLEKDADKAKLIAEELDALNRERQTIEHDIAGEAIQQIEREGREKDGVLFAYGENWHTGVIGIAASRIVEKYYRPALTISVHDGIGKGSCRSISGFNMYEALQFADDLLIQYGGHPMAAGFSIAAENIEAFRSRLNEYAASCMTEDDYVPLLPIDGEIKSEDITLPLISELTLLEPYGMGNSRPVFLLRSCVVDELRPIGKEKQHLRITVRCGGKTRLMGVGWSMADVSDILLEGDKVDMAFQLEQNEFNGTVSPQLILQDFRTTDKEVYLDRAVMIDIYLALKKCIPEWGIPVWQARKRLLAAEGARHDPHVIYAAIIVLKEIGILKIRNTADGPYYYFPVLAGKMQLDTSPTYQKYCKS